MFMLTEQKRNISESQQNTKVWERIFNCFDFAIFCM